MWRPRSLAENAVSFPRCFVDGMSFFVFLLWVHNLHDIESIPLPAGLCGVSPNFDAEARASGLGYGRHPKSDSAARCFEDLQGLSSKTAFCASARVVQMPLLLDIFSEEGGGCRCWGPRSGGMGRFVVACRSFEGRFRRFQVARWLVLPLANHSS